MNDIEEKLQVYLLPWWSNKELSLITGLAATETSKLKQEIIKKYGCVKGHGQKVYRDLACKYLEIDLIKEINLIKVVLG